MYTQDQVRQTAAVYLQQQANTHPAYNNMCMLCSGNNWQNDAFNSYSKRIEDYMQMSMVANKTDPQMAINEALNTITRLVAAFHAHQNPNVMNMLPPHEQNAIVGDAQKLRQIDQHLTSFVQSQQQQYQGYAPNYNQPSGYNAGYQQPNQPQGWGNMQQPQPSQKAAPAPWGSGQVSSRRDFMNGVERAPNQSNPNQVSSTLSWRTAPPTEPEKTPVPKPESKSQPVVIKPLIGIVKEISMDYAQHKTAPFFEAAHPSDNTEPGVPGRFKEALNSITGSSRVSEIINAADDSDPIKIKDSDGNVIDLGIDKSVYLPDLIIGATFVDPWSHVSRELRTNKPVICNMTTLYYDDDYYHGIDLEKLQAVNTHDNWLDYQEAVNDLYGEVLIPSTWSVINRRLTKCVNDILKVQLGLAYDIDSFGTDIKEMLDVIAEYHPEHVDLFNKCLKIPQNTITKIHTGEGVLEDLIKSSLPDSDLKPADVGGLAVLVNLITLDCYGKDINISFTGECGSIREGHTPAFYKAVKSIFEKQKMNVMQTVLYTIDGMKLYLHQSIDNKDTFFLTRN